MSILSTGELVEIKKIFDKYDSNNNGVIDHAEFCNMVDDLDVAISLNDRTILFDKIDSNHSGMINIEEFVECWKVED